MSEMGKMYYGLVPLEFGTPTGGGEPADPSVPICPDVDGSYTIPGTLIGDYTASGTFTPPPGVTVVHVAVISGGGQGGDRGWAGSADYCNGAGGTGGGVRVYRDVPVSGPVAVTIGGAGTESSFGNLTAPAGRRPGTATWLGVYTWNGSIPAQSPNLDASGGGGLNLGAWNNENPYANGQPGVQINGTYYAGGGGGGGGYNYYGSVGYGGSGGGGRGGTRDTGTQWYAQPGTNGLGGGGGGASHTMGVAPGVGGSGRVMVFTEQTTREAFAAPVEPVIHAALEGGVMVGAYAIDPVAPVDTLGVLVPYPLEPQPTGEVWTDEETGETHPVLAWPEKGWTYSNGDWSP